MIDLGQRRIIAASAKIEYYDGTISIPRALWGHVGTGNLAVKDGLLARIGFANMKRMFRDGGLFRQSSAPRFSVSEQPFDNSEDMLDFCPDGGFLALPTLELSLGPQGTVLDLRRTTVDLIADLAVFVRAVVRLISEMPLVPLFRLMCARVALHFPIQRRALDPSLSEKQTLPLQKFHHLCEQPLVLYVHRSLRTIGDR